MQGREKEEEEEEEGRGGQQVEVGANQGTERRMSTRRH
jgi:hypothetical protein